MQPIVVEIATAGTTIATLFMKNGFRPPQSVPVQASSQALVHDPKFRLVGSDSRLPPRIWSMSLSDVTTITYSGVRNQIAKRISTVQRMARCQVSARGDMDVTSWSSVPNTGK